jgi:hypothetical protein
MKLKFTSVNRSWLKLRAFAAGLMITTSLSLTAQVSSYTFSQSAGTYTPITGGTVLGVPGNDDTSFPTNPIGFSFCYNGALYTEFGVNSNGWITMGNGAVTSSYTAISSGINNNVIAALNYDLQGDATTGDLRYQTIGTAPNRTLVVQWTNYDSYQSAFNGDVFNFQIRLNENNGQIDIVYGNVTKDATVRLPQVGLRGASNADYNNVQISNGLQTWATPIAGTSNAASAEMNNALFPASGQTFTWTQPTAPAPAISATFTGVTATGMTLNWVDNSTNEANFIVQRSLDNVTFTTVTTITSTSIATTGTGYNYVATNLYNATLFYWRVLAANANCGNTFLAAQQSTLSGSMCGTYTVGPTGAYTSLTAAFAAVATNGVNCPLVFDLQAAYVSTVETFPLVIPFLGSGPANTITVRPELAATNLSITSNAAQTIDFSSAQYVIFDGRPGSVGTARHLTIENTSTTGNAVRFINDGANNGFNYCTIRGVNTSASSGVVVFSNALTGGIGNSNNFITNSELRDGATTPTNLIYALNSTANVFNTGNSFSNNIFHDWFSATAANTAISAFGGNTAWTVSNNSFYQTATRTVTTANTNVIVNLASGSGTATGAFVVTGNYFGGTAALCGGTAYTSTSAVAHRFIALQLTTGTGGANSVQGNTFRNFNFTTTSGVTTTNGVWCAINTTGTNGANNIGTITPNVIGSNTANNQIVTSVTTTGGLTVGYNNSASGAQNFSNNIIGGITANSSSATTSSSIVGIQTSSGTSNTISGNIVGSATLSGSLINAASTGTTSGQISGIVCSAFNTSLPGNQITNNTVMNLTNQYAGTSTTGYVRGIATTSGINTITGNTVSILSNASPQTGTTTGSAVIGISQGATTSGANQTVANNTINNLASLSLTANVNINALILNGTTLNRTDAYNNNISAIGAATSGVAVINGILVNGGNCRVYNNFVNIGVDATGASLTASHNFNGINKATGNRATIAFNSVRVAGTGVAAGTANTNAFVRAANPTATPADSVYSNIFVNERSNGASTGTHYAANLNNNTNWVANGNVYYGNGTGYVLGNIGATPYTGIAAWQAGSGQDANSFSVVPNFISSTNLHINNAIQSILESRAITMGNINTDIDNQVRPGPTAVNGGGIGHDIGADEFDGIPVNVDYGVQLIVSPLTSGCHTSTETVRVRLRNYATATVNMAVNPVTITGSVTGPNPATFGPVVISSGTIPAGGFIDTTIATNYNMSVLGTYVFNATSSSGTDFITTNDAMVATSISISGGTATANRPSICYGDSAQIALSGQTNGGTIQWQSSPDNLIWTNIPGATTSPLNTGTLSDTMFYRAIVCGTYPSVSDTVLVPFIAPPVVTNDTICGSGNVTLTAVGSGLQWYDAVTGGNLVNSGSTYTTPIANTTTWYVASSTGTPPTTHTTTFAAGNGSSGNMFTITAINTVTITGFDGHVTSGTSNWRIDYRPDNYLLVPGANTSATGWIPLGTATNVPAGGTGLPTPIPITFAVTIPAGQTYSFHVMTTAGSTVQYTNGTTVGNVYNANTDFQFREGHGGISFNCTNVPRVFNGRIHYFSGCESQRTPVTGVVTPAPVVNVASSNNICGNGTSTLVASSSNANYSYTWTPAATLNIATGDTVVASPSSTTTYIVSGIDAASGCTDSASVVVIHAMNPVGTATVSDDTVCVGTQVALDVTVGNPTVIIGTNQAQNTTTTYPAPYGNWYWGSRHQFLITAADLTAAGLAAGPIDALSFYVTALTATALNNFTIQMGQTNTASLTAFLSVPMTTVYSNVSYTPVLGINQHVFSTMFNWDGVSNIVVETCHNNSAYTYNCVFQLTNTSYNSSVYFYQDATGVCSNSTVNGTATQRPRMIFRRAFPYDYAWTPTSTLSNANIQNPTATIPGAISYYVTITDSTSGCAIMDTVDVFALATPAPYLGADTVICSNTPLTLDGSSGPYTYLWQDSTTAQTYNAGVFGTYNVNVTDTTSGCSAADTILIGVNVAPSFTLGTDVTLCAGNQTTFTGPSGTYSYLWSTGDTIDNIVTGTAGTYDLLVTDTTTACFSSDTVVLNVNPVPVVALGSDTTLCSSSTPVTLSAPAGNYNYLWNTTDTTQTILVSATGNYNVLVVDTATSCSSSDSIQLIVNLSPSVALGNDTTFCSNNGPLTLVAPAGPYNYVWSDMSTGTTLNAATTGNYYLDVTDSISGCVSTDSIMVTVPMSPAVTLNDTAFCGTNVTLTGPSGAYMYMWSTADTTQSILVTVSGTYNLTVTDSASGCIGSDSASVNVNANPTVVATASVLTPCADDADVILTGTPSGGTFTGTSVTGSQFDPSIGAGSYDIVYNFTDVNGCSGSDTVTINVNACVGVSENFAGSGMNVYPNPNSGIFTFAAANVDAKEMTIEIVTIEGQVIKSDKHSNVQGNFSEEINMNEFANGVYFMRVTTDGSVFTQRIVKQD